MSEKKIVGITMGDPASIGPEITVKAFADKSLYDLCNPVVVGDAGVMEAALPSYSGVQKVCKNVQTGKTKPNGQINHRFYGRV